MSSEIRQHRVAELLFEELSIMIASELSDPRISLVQVTKVDVTKDLRTAKIRVTHQDEGVTQRQLLKALQHATPYLRGQIASRCGLRMVPELFFHYDDLPEQAARVTPCSDRSRRRNWQDRRDGEGNPVDTASIRSDCVKHEVQHPQHSITLTARPPRAVSLYFVFMSAPVSIMVLITRSSET